MLKWSSKTSYILWIMSVVNTLSYMDRKLFRVHSKLKVYASFVFWSPCSWYTYFLRLWREICADVELMLQEEWRLSSTGVSPFLFPHYVPCLHISRSLINEWCCMDSQTAARLIFRNNWKRNVNLCQEFQINFRILGFMCQNNGPLLFPRISMTHSSL